MSALNDLIKQIENESLRNRVQQEVNRMSKQKKFGLVFEDHIPECTPLYDIPVRKNSLVAIKGGDIKEVFIVKSISEGIARCKNKTINEQKEIPVEKLVSIAQFGEPIYPYLKHVDNVCNDPDSDLWHTLIEADNYHALQLLEYLYPRKVDCIYIDPPYNTGARDWKYNNNYVDNSDAYRHSKWLSMMEKRLKIAKKLLNPKDSVLFVTIDEKEYLHLGCLLEGMFPEARIQMVSITINPHGAVRKDLFSRSDEYAFIVVFGTAHVIQPNGDGEEEEVRWWYLRRSDFASRRGTVKGGIAQFYPIYVDNSTNKIVKIGDPLPNTQSRDTVQQISGTTIVFPIRDNGIEMNWGVTGETLQKLINEGVVRVSKGNDEQPFIFRYLSANYTKKIKSKRWAVRGTREDGSKIIVETAGKLTRVNTVWKNKAYDAGAYGSALLRDVLGETRFSFPKSLYAVHDSIRFFVAEKKDAVVVDFFAGSGTTLHAVNLLNAEDGGHRRCIMVTNNEVSEDEAKELTNKGFKPGDDEWEKFGIARYVTWPRTVCSIEGHDINGHPLKGDYLDSDLPLADGFAANCEYFKLGFLDKGMVTLGNNFFELISVLWMKAGCIGQCPDIKLDDIPDMLILPKNHFAVLTDERYFLKFEQMIDKHPEIETVFIVTDSNAGYQEMISGINAKNSYQLYRDYLDNFRINIGR